MFIWALKIDPACYVEDGKAKRSGKSFDHLLRKKSFESFGSFGFGSAKVSTVESTENCRSSKDRECRKTRKVERPKIFNKHIALLVSKHPLSDAA